MDRLFVEAGSPWEDGYAESFNSRMPDELLDGELFLHLDEVNDYRLKPIAFGGWDLRRSG